ncbi:DMSO/TMAO reductase YedYZ molybdopterin-dependent catalytic subunit [Phyllobacterium trifolii]|jgi:DMSO/TMAO reductase YedYZ molybdopterin-dependent catalytic subunit|uniref:DMSO/TMAO reductase YedYZ molybdopterin-dependent catalytic subunit n=1 Tax=Phyllobacterium trifolii TaxID=300193 RepID=A0A839UEV9_9HYPH|nr:sulfite oxidase-like oxidoreductase [Phyllobacterium trifolii]MBB3149668.1 DMSO/TMAO reductase YedYZ molybdopterin-dependent catalytic subunit [Phyllobacterium trifolii]
MTTRGFTGRRQPPEITDRIPPGQTLTDDFPVLSAGPTPRVRTEDWSFTLKDGPKPLIKWSWAEFNALPQTKFTRDIHCVTAWSKLDTPWQGVLIDDIFAEAGIEPPTEFALAHSFDGYATNVPVKDLVGGKAMIATFYNGQPLTADHGGPARLLVPHLYFWKSAKWINGLQFTTRDEPGFWELRGYHVYGDPWREQRYTGD